jgi:hypothetical protein
MPNIEEFEKMKRDRLLDIIRRVLANPGEAKRVAEVLARDWTPMWTVDGKGKISIDLPLSNGERDSG